MSAEVSVVVPVGPRFDDLPAQLHALARQSFGRGFELIISRNGVSAERIDALVNGVTWPEQIDVRVVDASRRQGPSHARNVGWRRATGTIVLFCDADDVVDRRWVAQMTDALRRWPVIGGRLDYEQLNPTWLASWGAVSTDVLPDKFGHLPFAGSCNLGVRRDVLEALGGFDEGLSASEDVDLCWRAQYQGFEIALTVSAVVSYRRRADLRSLFLQARNDAHNDPALLQRHRAHGARWGVSDLAREVAGTIAALVGSPVSRTRRMQLATRLGRLSGHLREAPRMLTC